MKPPIEGKQASAEEVRRQASRHIWHHLGDRLFAGDPVYNTASNQWRVTIHSRSLPEDVSLGEMTLDAFGAVVSAPSRQQVQQRIETCSRSEGTTTAEITLTNRLVAALNRLAAVRGDLRAQLVGWREQLERGAARSEAALQAVLREGQRALLQVVPALSHPSLQAAYSTGVSRGIKTRGPAVPLRGGGADQGAETVLITTDAVPNARVAVEGHTLVVSFLDWQAPPPPMVVLVPDDDRHEPMTAVIVEGEAGTWTARFDRVPAGVYLLALAPVGESK